jgi:hypothetical protein
MVLLVTLSAADAASATCDGLRLDDIALDYRAGLDVKQS